MAALANSTFVVVFKLNTLGSFYHIPHYSLYIFFHWVAWPIYFLNWLFWHLSLSFLDKDQPKVLLEGSHFMTIPWKSWKPEKRGSHSTRRSVSGRGKADSTYQSQWSLVISSCGEGEGKPWSVVFASFPPGSISSFQHELIERRDGRCVLRL